MKTMLVAALLSVALSGCAATCHPPDVICPVPRDIGPNESLKNYTIHVLTLYTQCRAAVETRKPMPEKDDSVPTEREDGK